MTTDFSQLKIIFAQALTKQSRPERTKYLDEACGSDGELRRRIDELLQAHEQADPLLDRQAAEHLESLPGAQPEARAEFSLNFLDPPTRPGSLGRLGHYDVLEVLGAGGFGIVFRAFDETLQRVVAIKVLNCEIAATSPARMRFLREARSFAKVRHENVVHVYAVEEQPLPYLVMEFIPGETLQQRIDRCGPLAGAEVAQIGQRIAEGLAAAHAQGIIHRDIKPANILLEQGPKLTVKISDFGMARTVDDASLTQSGCIGGTPLFMSPEQAKGETLDHRTDLFSLGSLLYATCTGRPPFRAEGSYAILKRVAEDTPRPIREIIPEVPAWLCDIIARLHAKDPDRRLATASYVATLLARGVDTPDADFMMQSESKQLPKPAIQAPSRIGRWAIAAVLLAVVCFGFAEATAVTNFRGTIVRLFFPARVVIVEVEEPGIALEPPATQPAAPAAQPPANVPRVAALTDWEHSVAKLSRSEQLPAISNRLKELNPDYSGRVEPAHKLIDISLVGPGLKDISPLRALSGLKNLHIDSPDLRDLEVLRGAKLTMLVLKAPLVSDLAPLRGMPLQFVDLSYSKQVVDLSPLQESPLLEVNLAYTGVSDLRPLQDIKLKLLNCDSSKVTDLSPIANAPLTKLLIHNTRISKLPPLQDMPLALFNGENSALGDDAIDTLAKCPTLTFANLKRTNVTAQDIEKLKIALPRCKFEWDEGTIEPK